jgi:hypothetical protein
LESFIVPAKTANELPSKIKGKIMNIMFAMDTASSGAAFIVILTVLAVIRGNK